MAGPVDISRTEAPVTAKAYLLCVFAAFGGLLFGYDSAYISGVLDMAFFKRQFGHPVPHGVDSTGYLYDTWQKSLIVSILSAGTFLGALTGGELADTIGRRISVVSGCGVFIIGVILQVASTSIGLLVGGRLVAGIGIGIVSAVIILYMSEIAPKGVRGAIVSGYQFAITLGLLLAACVDQATSGRADSGSYRIPISVQFAWALVLGAGLLWLPESPRYLIMKYKHHQAALALVRLRGQEIQSSFIQDELFELQVACEYEKQIVQPGWLPCFKGGFKATGHFRRVMLGVLLQMFQQATGINFIFYYGTTFFTIAGFKNAFVIGIITTVVNVCSTPISFWTIEKFGRRPLLIWGAVGMMVCEFIVAIVGVVDPASKAANQCLIVFVCIYIFFFASTWGPGAWVLIGEIFPLPIRAKGVALSTASNWFWNCVIAVIIPYIVDSDAGNLGSKVFFVWGSTCALCVLFAYFCVPETKGLSLEQVDRMLDECTPIQSAKWKPSGTFAHEMGFTGKDKHLSNNRESIGTVASGTGGARRSWA